MYFLNLVLFIDCLVFIVTTGSEENNGYWPKYQSDGRSLPHVRMWNNHDQRGGTAFNQNRELPITDRPRTNQYNVYPENYYRYPSNSDYRGNGYDNFSPEWEARQAMKFPDHSNRSPERGWQRVSSSGSWEKGKLNQKNKEHGTSSNSIERDNLDVNNEGVRGYWASQPPRDIGWNEAHSAEIPEVHYKSSNYFDTSRMANNGMNNKHMVYFDYNFDNSAGRSYLSNAYSTCMNECSSRYNSVPIYRNRPSITGNSNTKLNSNIYNEPKYQYPDEREDQYDNILQNRRVFNENNSGRRFYTSDHITSKPRGELWYNGDSHRNGIYYKYHDDDDESKLKLVGNVKRKNHFDIQNYPDTAMHPAYNASDYIKPSLATILHGDKLWDPTETDSRISSFTRHNNLKFDYLSDNKTDIEESNNYDAKDRISSDEEESIEMDAEKQKSSDLRISNKERNNSDSTVEMGYNDVFSHKQSSTVTEPNMRSAFTSSSLLTSSMETTSSVLNDKINEDT